MLQCGAELSPAKVFTVASITNQFGFTLDIIPQPLGTVFP